MSLPTLIAELEEALKAATAGPWSDHKPGMGACWIVDPDGDPLWIAPDGDPNTISYQDARLIALMRNHLPALIEAVKRQREALEMIADPATRVREVCEKYDEPVTLPLDMWHAREIARAALKETTDV